MFQISARVLAEDKITELITVEAIVGQALRFALSNRKLFFHLKIIKFLTEN